jgi:hypothetical protein
LPTTGQMVKGFNRPFKNDVRKAKKAEKRGSVGVPLVRGAPHLKGAEKHLPRGLALPQRSKKKQRQLERYARICEREAAAAAAPPRDAAMK